MKRLTLGLPIVLLLSAFSHADSIFAVTGQATFNGFALCGASACVETLHFSFELGYGTQQTGPVPGSVLYIVPNTMSETSTGPLDPFGPGALGFASTNFVSFVNDQGDNIDLIELNNGVASAFSPTNPPPSFPSATLECTNPASACIQDFTPFLQNPISGTIETTIVEVPEESELTMLGITTLVLCGVMLAKHNFNRAGGRQRVRIARV
jgi:hypothetical protein